MKYAVPILCSLLLLSPALWGQQGLSVQSQTLIINKLSNVALKLPDNDPSKARVLLRLADLHSERGRSLAKKDLEDNCIQCTEGQSDRQQALEYYEMALPSLSAASKKRVQTQVGHLYELLGKTGEAERFYTQVVSEKGASSGGGEAQFSLAEIHFKKNQYAKAKSSYEKSLVEKGFRRRGLANYRIAWCDYNLGQINPALSRLEKILSSDALLNRGVETLTNKDEDFQAEVAKDYTVFVSHKEQITKNDIQKVHDLSPKESRLENVTFLAKELERLGQVDGAIAAWGQLIPQTSNPSDRVEALVYLGGVQLKAKKYDQTLNSFKKAMSNYKAMGPCATDQCSELIKRMRQIVLDWNRIEAKNPSENLIEAYSAYIVFAPKDQEALRLGVQAAVQSKKFKLAQGWNQKLILLLGSGKNEKALLRAVEIAEMSGDKGRHEKALGRYLAQAPEGKNALEVEYNLANIEYEKKNYEKAFEKFDRLVQRKARVSGGSNKIALQSAELALDSLVLLKDDVRIEQYSRSYATQFPKEAGRFQKINRQSVLAQTAKIAGDLSAKNSSSMSKAWETLERFRADQASSEEKISFYKNRVILARKMRKYDDLLSSVNMLLQQKNLSKEDYRFAHENKVFVSELKLDFKSALASFQTIHKDRWIELARLSDLAEGNSRPYYQKYLNGSPDNDLAQGICARLVKETSVYSPQVKSCLPYLRSNEAFFSQLFLKSFDKDQNLEKGLAFLAKHKLMGTSAARILNREKLFKKLEPSFEALSIHKLNPASNRVAGSIQKRNSLLAQSENRLSSVVQSGDWALQFYFLSQLRDEQIRFYNELVQLPPPEGLSTDEQQQYISLLGQQAQPFKTKGEELGLKVQELNKTPWGLDGLLADYHNSQGAIQNMLGKHIEKVQSKADDFMAGQVYLVSRKAPKAKVPSLLELEQARRKVQSNPHDALALQSLLSLEKRRGHQPTIQYLQSRLDKIGEEL